MKKKNKSNVYLKIKRQQMLDAGAYDGRYRTRIVIDKKKEESKRKCRERSISE